MGHKLSTALILLNAMGILACVILIAAAIATRPKWQYGSSAQSNPQFECSSLELDCH
jgi:hypothetical protein